MSKDVNIALATVKVAQKHSVNLKACVDHLKEVYDFGSRNPEYQLILSAAEVLEQSLDDLLYQIANDRNKSK